VASRAYLRRAGAPATPQDLATHDCLHYLRPGDTPAWSFEPDATARAGKGRVSVAVRGVFAANNSEALREAAVAGLGIALLPDFSAQAAVQSGKLQLVLPQWKPVGAFGEHLYAIRPYSPLAQCPGGRLPAGEDLRPRVTAQCRHPARSRIHAGE
jgi:DNA-binding transcriptional LysR family regulator